MEDEVEEKMEEEEIGEEQKKVGEKKRRVQAFKEEIMEVLEGLECGMKRTSKMGI